MRTDEPGLSCCEPHPFTDGVLRAARAEVVADGQPAEHTYAHAHGPHGARPRRLLLCLDGVPFELMREAQARGLFSAFNEPARLLSPFPTMTNIALAAMLHASVPVGYESRYFDRDAQAMRGGIEKYIGRRTPDKVPSSYMDELDYQEPLPFEYLVYVAPDAVWRADMRRFRQRFRAAPRERDYFGFLKGTDGLLHVRGARKLAHALESLDPLIREIHAWCGQETEIVLFSDHGMSLEESRKIHLVTHLEEQGYEVCTDFRGRGRRKIAVPAFGLIGYAALFCSDDADPAELSASVNTLEGVDFSMYRDGASAVVVRNQRSAARIRRARDAQGTRYAYEQIDGDPLALKEIMRAMQAAGEFDAQGYAPDDVWLARTAAHTYPDALANLFEAMHGTRVRHTADVLLSCRDGYYYGWSLLDRFVRIMATHGSATRGSSTAFLMSTHRRFGPFVRGTEARPLLRD